MPRALLFITLFIFTVICNLTGAQEMKNNEKPDSLIFPIGNLNSDEFFTGKAWASLLVEDDKTFNCPVYNVTFEPGARTNWHKHGGGQLLLVTKGNGFYQERGKTPRALKAGDTVKIPPTVEHWHGAAAESKFIHIAICPKTDKGGVEWLKPVTEHEYKLANIDNAVIKEKK